MKALSREARSFLGKLFIFEPHAHTTVLVRRKKHNASLFQGTLDFPERICSTCDFTPGGLNPLDCSNPYICQISELGLADI